MLFKFPTATENITYILGSPICAKFAMHVNKIKGVGSILYMAKEKNKRPCTCSTDDTS
jgi:hypothetical protein